MPLLHAVADERNGYRSVLGSRLEEMVVHIGEYLAAALGVDEPFGVHRIPAHRRIDDVE